MAKYTEPLSPWREKVYEIIFEADTREGKLFDVVLLWMIVASVLVVMLETVDSAAERFGNLLYWLEWVFTIFFTIEYVMRLVSTRRPLRYAFSFFGIIDFLAILPSYLRLFLPGTQYFLMIRVLRLFRIFRIFKLVHFLNEGAIITDALKRSRAKITVFLVFIILMVTVVGSFMYVIEGNVNPKFSSIPASIYWGIVTLTTVGFGDIYPITPLGRFLAALVMIMGYGVIAVPTGIVTAELASGAKEVDDCTTQVCHNCHQEGHDSDAEFCKYCGELLNE